LPSNGTSQRRRRLWQGPDDARESAALEQLASFPAASGDFVFRRADRLFRAARRFHGQQIAVACRRYESEAAILFPELDQPHAFTRTRRSEEHTSELQSRVDLVCRLP